MKNIILDLPLEILHDILTYLTVNQILNFGKCSKECSRISNFVLEIIIARCPLRLVIGVIYYKNENMEEYMEILSRFEVGKVYPSIIQQSQTLNTLHPNEYSMLNTSFSFVRLEVSVIDINHQQPGFPKLLDILKYPTKVSIGHGYSSHHMPYVPEAIYNLGHIYILGQTHMQKYIITPKKGVELKYLNRVNRREDKKLGKRNVSVTFHLIFTPKLDI